MSKWTHSLKVHPHSYLTPSNLPGINAEQDLGRMLGEDSSREILDGVSGSI